MKPTKATPRSGWAGFSALAFAFATQLGAQQPMTADSGSATSARNAGASYVRIDPKCVSLREDTSLTWFKVPKGSSGGGEMALRRTGRAANFADSTVQTCGARPTKYSRQHNLPDPIVLISKKRPLWPGDRVYIPKQLVVTQVFYAAGKTVPQFCASFKPTLECVPSTLGINQIRDTNQLITDSVYARVTLTQPLPEKGDPPPPPQPPRQPHGRDVLWVPVVAGMAGLMVGVAGTHGVQYWRRRPRRRRSRHYNRARLPDRPVIPISEIPIQAFSQPSPPGSIDPGSAELSGIATTREIEARYNELRRVVSLALFQSAVPNATRMSYKPGRGIEIRLHSEEAARLVGDLQNALRQCDGLDVEVAHRFVGGRSDDVIVTVRALDILAWTPSPLSAEERDDADRALRAFTSKFMSMHRLNLACSAQRVTPTFILTSRPAQVLLKVSPKTGEYNENFHREVEASVRALAETPDLRSFPFQLGEIQANGSATLAYFFYTPQQHAAA